MPPNIVFICTDDQDDLNDPAYMPKLKQYITDLGIKYTRCYTERSVCGPSRASMLTGMCSHNTDVLGNDKPEGGYWKYKLLEANALPVWLQAEGYKVWHVGKFMNHFAEDGPGPTHIPVGYDEWFVGPLEPEFTYFDFDISDNGTVVSYTGHNSANYLTNVFTDKVVELIAASGPEPFFAFVWYLAPHNPAEPAPIDTNNFGTVTMPQRLNYNEDDVSDKPTYIQGRDKINTNKAQARWRERRECLLSVDRGIESIVNALTAKGVLASTVIIYMSDNGYTQGEHRLSGKENTYEEGGRVPLIIKGPGINNGVTCSSLVWNIDITATICELAEATPGRTQDGVSLVPTFTDQTPAGWRTALMVTAEVDTVYPVKAVYTDEWSFHVWEGSTGPPRPTELELYRLTTDPFQMTNKANGAATATVQAELADALDTLVDCEGAECLITDAFTAGVPQIFTLRTKDPDSFRRITVAV